MSILRYLQESFHDYVTINNQYRGKSNVELYKDPTPKEIRRAAVDSYEESFVRLAMNRAGELFAWNGETLHKDMQKAAHESWAVRFLLNTKSNIVQVYSSQSESDIRNWEKYKHLAIPELVKAIPNIKHIEDQFTEEVLWTKGDPISSDDNEMSHEKANKILRDNRGFLDYLRKVSGKWDEINKLRELKDDEYNWIDILEIFEEQIPLWKKSLQ